MRKYLELFKDGFDSTINEKIKPENRPYVGYSPSEGVQFTVIPKPITYEAVDLGLPSGLKWANKNIGAETPQDNGLYFSWGNVGGHAVDENGNTTDGYSFDSTTYSTTLGGQYTGNTLDAEHDAATVNMSSDWRIPTMEEVDELLKNTDHYYIGEDDNIVAGPVNYGTYPPSKGLDDSIKLRSICFVKQGGAFDYDNRSNFIEFPFAGYYDESLLVYEGVRGNVWSSSVDEDEKTCAYNQYFDNGGRLGVGGSHLRYNGLSVRGVHF